MEVESGRIANRRMMGDQVQRNQGAMDLAEEVIEADLEEEEEDDRMQELQRRRSCHFQV